MGGYPYTQSQTPVLESVEANSALSAEYWSIPPVERVTLSAGARLDILIHLVTPYTEHRL